MKTLYEVLKGFFFFLTVIVALFFLRGQILFSSYVYSVIKLFIMPGYLVFCGLMIGYLIANIWPKAAESNNIYIKSFIIGIIIGVILSVSYIFI